MTNRLLVVVAVFLTLPIVSARAGGDLGGGGAPIRPHQKILVNQKMLETLRQQKDLSQAKRVWLENMSAEEELEVLNNFFRQNIAPQIVQSASADDNQ